MLAISESREYVADTTGKGSSGKESKFKEIMQGNAQLMEENKLLQF